MQENPKQTQKNGDRNVFCPHYGHCLDHAVKYSWDDWDCGECMFRSTRESYVDAERSCGDTFPYYVLPLDIYMKVV